MRNIRHLRGRHAATQSHSYRWRSADGSMPDQYSSSRENQPATRRRNDHKLGHRDSGFDLFDGRRAQFFLGSTAVDVCCRGTRLRSCSLKWTSQADYLTDFSNSHARAGRCNWRGDQLAVQCSLHHHDAIHDQESGLGQLPGMGIL